MAESLPIALYLLSWVSPSSFAFLVKIPPFRSANPDPFVFMFYLGWTVACFNLIYYFSALRSLIPFFSCIIPYIGIPSAALYYMSLLLLFIAITLVGYAIGIAVFISSAMLLTILSWGFLSSKPYNQNSSLFGFPQAYYSYMVPLALIALLLGIIGVATTYWSDDAWEKLSFRPGVISRLSRTPIHVTPHRRNRNLSQDNAESEPLISSQHPDLSSENQATTNSSTYYSPNSVPSSTFEAHNMLSDDFPTLAVPSPHFSNSPTLASSSMPQALSTHSPLEQISLPPNSSSLDRWTQLHSVQSQHVTGILLSGLSGTFAGLFWVHFWQYLEDSIQQLVALPMELVKINLLWSWLTIYFVSFTTGIAILASFVLLVYKILISPTKIQFMPDIMLFPAGITGILSMISLYSTFRVWLSVLLECTCHSKLRKLLYHVGRGVLSSETGVLDSIPKENFTCPLLSELDMFWLVLQVGIPVVSLVFAGFWGIVYYRELKGGEHIRVFFTVGIILVMASSLVFSVQVCERWGTLFKD